MPGPGSRPTGVPDSRSWERARTREITLSSDAFPAPAQATSCRSTVRSTGASRIRTGRCSNSQPRDKIWSSGSELIRLWERVSCGNRRCIYQEQLQLLEAERERCSLPTRVTCYELGFRKYFRKYPSSPPNPSNHSNISLRAEKATGRPSAPDNPLRDARIAAGYAL
jgi:hypothetical protein